MRDVALAEEAGFEFAVISDHYFPWLDAQGHAPYAWSVLGAAAQATDHVPLMTHVTCPIRRLSPRRGRAKAAAMQLLSDGAGGSGKPCIGQIALSYDPDHQTAVKRG